MSLHFSVAAFQYPAKAEFLLVACLKRSQVILKYCCLEFFPAVQSCFLGRVYYFVGLDLLRRLFSFRAVVRIHSGFHRTTELIVWPFSDRRSTLFFPLSCQLSFFRLAALEVVPHLW